MLDFAYRPVSGSYRPHPPPLTCGTIRRADTVKSPFMNCSSWKLRGYDRSNRDKVPSGIPALLDAALLVRSSSEENFSGRGDFSRGVNMGSDSIPPKLYRVRV